MNIRGIDNVLIAIKEVFASLYNDRAIAYRVHKGFEHAGVALSAGIQRMVRSETVLASCLRLTPSQALMKWCLSQQAMA